MKIPPSSARSWLAENGYHDVARMIDEIMAEWKAAGKATRRAWWDILAGDAHGNGRTVAGRNFPVIAAIRRRQHLKPSKHAISNSRRERALPIVSQNRWASK